MAFVAGARRHPRRVAALGGVLALLAVSWLVVRHSSLSAVRRVEVQGVSGMDSGAIESALVAAARRQSTLGVDVGALRAAVAPYHLVSGLRVSASFPHSLRITVAEQLPVATLRNGGEQVVVAADGAVLDPSVAAGAAPTIDVTSLPVGQVSDPQLLAELTILGAAPPALLHRVARIYPSPNGFAVSMRNGLVIFFGDTTRPRAKWLSAARVIASPLAGRRDVRRRARSRPSRRRRADPGDVGHRHDDDARRERRLDRGGAHGGAEPRAGGAASATGAAPRARARPRRPADDGIGAGGGDGAGAGAGTGAAAGTGGGQRTGTAAGSGTGTAAGHRHRHRRGQRRPAPRRARHRRPQRHGTGTATARHRDRGGQRHRDRERRCDERRRRGGRPAAPAGPRTRTGTAGALSGYDLNWRLTVAKREFSAVT